MGLRQKVYTGVKERSGAWQEAAETLHGCKGMVGCAREYDQNVHALAFSARNNDALEK